MAFRNARQVDASHGIFNDVRGTQIIVNRATNTTNLTLRKLRSMCATSAAFDSAERYPVPDCLPGTRKAIKDAIMEILLSPNGHRICWLNGMAGSGKSAVAQSLAEVFWSRERLAASFFFSRKATTSARYLFPTIALQMTISFPSLKSLINDALRDDPTIRDKALRFQFKKLIIDPISKTEAPKMPMAVVIDAIDECEDKHLALEIISLIASACTDSFPVKFLFTSRPDPYIRAAFTSPEIAGITWTFFLQDFDAQDDIRIFLRHRFGEISASRPIFISETTSSWPKDLDVEALLRRSSGLFIFAATVMNYIGDKHEHPVRQLEKILEVEPRTSSSAYADLDQLYIQILSNAPHVDSFKRILGVITVLFEPLPICTLENLLSLERGHASLALEGLHSVLIIPDDEDRSITIYHESFRDFLMDANRSDIFFIAPPEHHNVVVHHCLDLMATQLEKDSCCLHHPTLFGPMLWYACDYWAFHLSSSIFSISLVNDLEEFAIKSLLCWIEVLRITNESTKALQFVQATNQWLIAAKIGYDLFGLLKLFHETEQYISAFNSPGIFLVSEHWREFRMSRIRGTMSYHAKCECGFAQMEPEFRVFWRRLLNAFRTSKNRLHLMDANVHGKCYNTEQIENNVAKEHAKQSDNGTCPRCHYVKLDTTAIDGRIKCHKCAELIENWMIPSYEIEFGHRIGVGGFGEVYEGFWNKTHVAIKVLKSHSGITPSSTAIRREIETWSTLRHPHVLQFLGANDLDDKPFIVMPYLRNGNARDYVQNNPQCNRLRILYHAALGLLYLHVHSIVHGDLKALNILIDDAGHAVLCDFGLSRIKADVSSSMASNTMTPSTVEIIGSRNWMAPERLLGGKLTKPSDIYALGMTLYEIFANEVPLAHINYGEFCELVVKRDVRPERPDEDTAPTLTDAIWELAEQCWVQDPHMRPTANTVCDIMSNLLKPVVPCSLVDLVTPFEVKLQDISTQDIVIAVMGPRASGKSTFIDVVTERDKNFCDEPRPSTPDIRSIKVLHPFSHRYIVLVDVPGSDDTGTSDFEIFKATADWLKDTYERNILLTGIIYLHRISDCRMIGAPSKNLRLFSQLCGKDATKNVVLVTTMWNPVKAEVEQRREAELRAEYWAELVDNGCQIARFENTLESAREVIDKIIGNTPHPLLIQKEMVDLRHLSETRAGSTLCNILQKLLADQQEAIRTLRDKTKPPNDPQLIGELIEQYQSTQRVFRRQIEQMKTSRLTPNVKKRFYK